MIAESKKNKRNENNKRFIFHLAGKQFSTEDSEWHSERNNQIVLIRKELKKEKLISQLKSCINKGSGKGFE